MITLAYGLPGMGKSSLLHDLVKSMMGQHLFLVSDHEAGWGPDAIFWRGEPPEIAVIEAGQSPPEEYPESGIIVFRNRDPRDIAQICIDVGNCCYVDDEVDKAGRRKGFDDSPLRYIVNEGRHLPNAQGVPSEVHVLAACRRPQKIHNDVSEMADQVYIFKLMGRNTLKRLLDDSMIEDDEWDVIRQLEKFHFKHWPSNKWLSVEPVGGKQHATKSNEKSTHPDDGANVRRVHEGDGRQLQLRHGRAPKGMVER